MRRSRSQSQWGEDDDAVDVLLVEDDDQDVPVDEVRAVLHELALEAMARRATWAADLHPAGDRDAGYPGSADDDGSDGAGEPRGLVHRAVRRYRRRAATAAALVLVVAVTVAVVQVRQTAAREAALAAMPAVLAPLAGPPAELWRVPGRVVGDQHDTLLVVDGTSLRSVDPTTGVVAWTASADAGRAAATGGCFAVDEGLRPDRAPPDDGAGPRGLVACATGAGSGTSGGGPTGGALVVVVDGSTGRTRHTVTTVGSLLLAEPAGRDLLVAAGRDDGTVRVTRWDLATGTPRWDRTSTRPAVTADAADHVARRPDSLTVGTFAVDLATGEEIDAERESDEPYPYVEHALPGGARATWAWREGGTSGRGRVFGGGGSMYFLPGPPLRPPVTDGSDAGVLVVQTDRRDRLRGLDLRSGRTEWSRLSPGSPDLAATALVDGVMLLDDGDTVTALDVRTGDDVWRTRVGTRVGTEDVDRPALTDGELVVLPVRGDGGAVSLVAHRIDDGTAVWRTAAPSGTVALTVVDHHLIASTEDEVVGLG